MIIIVNNIYFNYFETKLKSIKLYHHRAPETPVVLMIMVKYKRSS